LTFSLGGCLSDEGGSDFTPNDAGTGNTGNTGNRAPIISGSAPAAVKVGEAYSFTPSASDADGDPLTFSIENKPSWLEFNSSTGRISGTPTLGNVGTFSSIRISVSDGQASASLRGFSIDVTQVATASTTLSWTPPTLNEDGTTLVDLAGYKIYYGKSSGSYTNSIRVDNPTVTTYLVENLSPDTYYFAATAFNASGVESRYSGEAVKTLN
jgi:hypothetical protein